MIGSMGVEAERGTFVGNNGSNVGNSFSVDGVHDGTSVSEEECILVGIFVVKGKSDGGNNGYALNGIPLAVVGLFGVSVGISDGTKVRYNNGSQVGI